jgi:hypothetical protein
MYVAIRRRSSRRRSADATLDPVVSAEAASPVVRARAIPDAGSTAIGGADNLFIKRELEKYESSRL